MIAILCSGVVACAKFPELEVSEAQFDRKTPYPKFVPLDVLLKEPEASITDDVQDELTTRRDDLQSTPDAASSEETNDPVLDRLDALRARRDEEKEPIIDDDLRKRLEGGITPPTIPE